MVDQPRNNALSTRCGVDVTVAVVVAWLAHRSFVSRLQALGVVDGGWWWYVMANGQRTARTAKKREQFLAALRSNGTVYAACQAAHIGRTFAYEWRADDEDFRAAWDEALEDATDQLEDVAIRRAADGSDTLLIFLLKARRPEQYRDTTNANVNMKATHEHSGPNGSAIPIQFFDASAALATIAAGSEADL